MNKLPAIDDNVFDLRVSDHTIVHIGTIYKVEDYTDVEDDLYEIHVRNSSGAHWHEFAYTSDWHDERKCWVLDKECTLKYGKWRQ